MSTQPTIGQLAEHVRDNGPALVRHDGITYEVKHFGTFKIDEIKHEETPDAR